MVWRARGCYSGLWEVLLCEQREQLKLLPLYRVLQSLMGHRLTFNLSLIHQAPVAMDDKSQAQDSLPCPWGNDQVSDFRFIFFDFRSCL